MSAVILYVSFCVAVGMFAQIRRNRIGVGWFALSFIISPLIAGIIVAILPKLGGLERDSRLCPFCAEPVKLAAKICKHCHSELPPPVIDIAPQRGTPPSGMAPALAVAGTIAVIVLLIITVKSFSAHAGEREQTRFYDARGNSIGTAAPQGQGTTRYYDSRGNSLGTSTTTPGGTTTFYGPGGNVTGRSSGPAPSRR